MELAEFEAAVHEAIAAVPKRFRDKMENVACVISHQPRRAGGTEEPIMSRGMLLGLYQGVPYGSRGPWYSGMMPDKITLFKSTIEIVAGHDPIRIRQQIKDTVWHEIGHYFGMSEADVRRWEKRRTTKPKPAH